MLEYDQLRSSALATGPFKGAPVKSSPSDDLECEITGIRFQTGPNPEDTPVVIISFSVSPTSNDHAIFTFEDSKHNLAIHNAKDGFMLRLYPTVPSLVPNRNFVVLRPLERARVYEWWIPQKACVHVLDDSICEGPPGARWVIGRYTSISVDFSFVKVSQSSVGILFRNTAHDRAVGTGVAMSMADLWRRSASCRSYVLVPPLLR